MAQTTQSQAAAAEAAADKAEAEAEDKRVEAQRKAAEATAAEQAGSGKEPQKVKSGYVVLVDMYTYSTGEKIDQVARAGRGQLVEPDPKFNDIERMIQFKALAKNDGKAHRRTTAQVAAAAAGAPDDPVKVPSSEVLAETATALQIEEASK